MYGQQCEDTCVDEEIDAPKLTRAGQAKASSNQRKIVESIYGKLETLENMLSEAIMQSQRRNDMFLGAVPEKDDDNTKCLPQGIFSEIETKVEDTIRQARRIIELNERFNQAY